MGRRKPTVQGFVHFPIGDPKFRDTKEGGVFVRLVVTVDSNELACFGGSNYIIYDETLVGVDKPHHNSKCKDPLDMYIQEEAHFPHINNGLKGNDKYYPYISIPYYSVITMGSTGWSGWNREEENYWKCTIKNLTREGRKLYDSIQKLYPKSDLILQTWLDT